MIMTEQVTGSVISVITHGILSRIESVLNYWRPWEARMVSTPVSTPPHNLQIVLLSLNPFHRSFIPLGDGGGGGGELCPSRPKSPLN